MSVIDSEDDREKFQQIYQQYKDKMYLKSYDILQNREEAENIVQESFVRIIDHLDQIGCVDSQKTWNYILTVVKHLCFNHKKKMEKYESCEWTDEWSVSCNAGNQGTEQNALENRLTEELTEEIRALPYPYKEVLYLQYYNGMSSSEIGKILDKSSAAVRKISERARKKLKTALEQKGYYDESAIQ
jgi:RNA polymerase sigma-70 factor (ECF subfamily)